jgi:hypothetical protein
MFNILRGIGERLLSQGAAPPPAVLTFTHRPASLSFVTLSLIQRIVSLTPHQGYSTPFLNVPSSFMVPSVSKAKDIVRDISAFITTNGLPPAITPMVFGFTGSGNVSNGAREIFELLPHEYVPASALASITSAPPSRWSNKLVGCMLTPQDMVCRVTCDGV